MFGSLVTFIILGRRSGVNGREETSSIYILCIQIRQNISYYSTVYIFWKICSNWFIGILRPLILVMAEILIWQGYCQQFGLTYHFKRKYGISILIMALFGVVAALLKFWSYTRIEVNYSVIYTVYITLNDLNHNEGD